MENAVPVSYNKTD